MKENLTAYVYFAGWRIVRWLPEKFAYSLAYSVADILARRNGKSVQRYEKICNERNPTSPRWI